jgi:hypothetical protein
MPVLPFSEYRPDVSDYNGQTSKNIINALPRGDGYGPFGNFSAFTGALPATCRGSFAARNTDGSIAIFAGTSTKLYKLNNTSGSWTDVSLGASTYTTLANTANWTFVQFNNYVFATQVNAKLQIFDLTSSTAFADRADSNCPQAAYVAVVNGFLLLGGLASPNVFRIYWSGLNDVSSSSAFTTGLNSCDFQDLSDGGIVKGVTGGEYGLIFQDQAIRQMLYAPGTPYVFQINRIAVDDGLYAPYSLIRSGNNTLWLSPQGFKIMPPGGQPTPIGKERVDRTFFADVDSSNLQLVIGANDPTSTRVFWAYKSIANSMSTFDKILVYDWSLDKWSLIVDGGFAGGTFISSLAQPGITLEGVDAAFGTGTPVAVTSATTAGVFTAQQTLTAGQGVILTSTVSSGLPTGFTASVPYYISATSLTTSSFKLSASGGIGALAGAVVTSTSTGSGTLSYAVESIEALSLGSLDNISVSSLVRLSGIDTNNKFGFFSGSNLQATLETPEQGGDGTRFFVRGFRIVSDATTGSLLGSCSFREGPQATFTYTAEASSDARGYVPLRQSTRYARGKVRIPQGTTWTYAAGVEPDVATEGLR